jgi:HlyD family secretion protein
MKKAVKWVMVVICTVLLGVYGYYEYTKPLEAELITVNPSRVEISFKEKGVVESTESRDIYSDLPLKVIKVNVLEGSAVKQGDILFELDSTSLQRELDVAKAQLIVSESIKGKSLKDIKNQIAQLQLARSGLILQINDAKKELDRVQKLFNENNASEAQVDAAKTLVDTLTSTLSQQDAVLSQLKVQGGRSDSETAATLDSQIEINQTMIANIQKQMEYCTVKSTINGIVTRLTAKVGVPVSPQQPACTIIDNGSRKLVVHVLTSDLSDIHVGMPVSIVQEGKSADLTLEGAVKNIAPEATERISSLGLSERRVRIEIGGEAVKALFEGSEAEATFITKVEVNRILVPKISLFKDTVSISEKNDAVISADNGTKSDFVVKSKGSYYVWVVKNNKALMQKVEKGLETDLEAVVLEGLSPGDVIVKNPNIEGLKVGGNIK